MNKTYLCIGGPLHGQEKSIYEGARGLVTPLFEPPTFHGPETPIPDFDSGYREGHYAVRKVLLTEYCREGAPGTPSVTVRVDIEVEVLAYEAVLTNEELGAWYRKLRGRLIREGVILAFNRMRFAR